MNNNNTATAVSRGLAQSAAGETVDLGDFTQYLIPDAAVEAAARALRIEEVGDSAPPGFAARQWDIGETPREKPVRLARAALSAALPFLGAAPSATREDVADVLVMTRLSDYAGTDMAIIDQAADALLARFTITPRAD